MKKLILTLLFFSLLSCGKSVYYVYDTTNDEDHYSYCTLEITINGQWSEMQKSGKQNNYFAELK